MALSAKKSSSIKFMYINIICFSVLIISCYRLIFNIYSLECLCQVLVRWMPKILSKNTFYRFFNSVKTNWLRFISLLAFDIVNNNLKELTDDKIKNVFIIDDSLFNRTSCKKTGLWSKVFWPHRYASQKSFSDT